MTRNPEVGASETCIRDSVVCRLVRLKQRMRCGLGGRLYEG
jgi:hypothetical protein